MTVRLNGIRVLIMGGGGFIGQWLIRKFLACGAKVRVVDIAARVCLGGFEENHDFEWIIGNVSDAALVSSAVQMCDVVIFLATSSLPASANTDLSAEIASHVHSTVKVAEICNSQRVKRFIFASSGGTVYGVDSTKPLTEDSPTLPRNAYGVSKLAIEHYLRVLGSLREMRTLSLRIANPYGEGQVASRGQGFIAAAMERAFSGEPLRIWGDGSVIRDFVYVGNVADAFTRASLYNGTAPVLNVGSGVGYSLLQIIDKVAAATGKKINLEMIHGRQIDAVRNVLDVRAAYSELSWAPSTAIEQGLAATAAWWASKPD